MISVSYPEFEYIGLGNGAANVNRSVSVQTYQNVITKVSTVSLEYILHTAPPRPLQLPIPRKIPTTV